MTITPSYVLGARAIAPTEGQLDLFATEGDEKPVPAETQSEHAPAADTDNCPPRCPCHWADQDDDRSTTERTDR